MLYEITDYKFRKFLYNLKCLKHTGTACNCITGYWNYNNNKRGHLIS